MTLFDFGKAITYPLARVLFRIRYEGLQNIPRDKGFILACNHRSYWDPLFIAHKVPQRLRYIAKQELFRNRFFGGLLLKLGAFPVERGAGDSGALDRSAQIVSEGGVLTIFPEGTRSRDGKPLRARSGVAMIAGRSGADVLPCAVVYEGKLRLLRRVTVRYGRLIPHGELAIDINSPASLRAASKRIMGAIVELLEGREE